MERKQKNAKNDWKCNRCGETFRTRRELEKHKKECSINFRDGKRYSLCKWCGKEFEVRQLCGHVINCKYNPNLDLIRKKQSEHNYMRGRHHNEEEKSICLLKEENIYYNILRKYLIF